MKSIIGRCARGMGIVVVAGVLAQPAAALPTLIFIDNFEDADVRTPSPLPGQPGGGEIGHVNFYTIFSNVNNTLGGTTVVENSYLQMTVGKTVGTAGEAALSLRTPNRTEFRYIDCDVGQGLELSIRELWMDWGEATNKSQIGFLSGAAIYSATSGVYASISPQDSRIILYAKDTGDTWGTALANWTPTGTEVPTGFDIYVDKQFYFFRTYYDDDSVREAAGEHNLNAGSVVFDQNPLLICWFGASSTNIMETMRIGEVTVTQIPEPGGVGLLALAAVAIRLRRRKSASAA